MRRLDQIQVECPGCRRRASVPAVAWEGQLGAELSLRTVASLYGKLKCSSCGERACRIFNDRDRLLIDPDNVTPCKGCGSPIILPRLEARPGTTLCMDCAEDRARPKPDRPHPLPPLDLRRCPVCDEPTVVRQNQQDDSYFVSCTAFPSCMWKAPFEK